MSERPLIIVSLEGFTPRSLGCYGSSWNATPAIDRVAAGGCVWDRCVANSDEPAAVIGGWVESDRARWVDPWKKRGTVEWLTDDLELIHGFRQPCFDIVETVPPANSAEVLHPAESVEETQFGQLTAAAIQRGMRDQSWSVLWLHSGFLTRCWDAPRNLFEIDEQEPEFPEPLDAAELLEREMDAIPSGPPNAPPFVFDDVEPPAFDLQPDAHPDLINSWMRTYGCQIRLVDLLIEILLDSLQPLEPTLALLGTSGFRLGQCGSVGHRPASLSSADIHLPLLVGNAGPLRIPQLANSGTAIDWISRIALDGNVTSPYPPEKWKDRGEKLRVETQTKRCRRVLTTSDWFYVSESDERERLYLKPDDIEDCNDISSLRGDVVQELIAEPSEPIQS